MSKITTTVNMIADKAYQATNESGNTLDFDMLAADKKQAFSPMQALLSSLAACSAVDLVQMIKKRKKQLNDLKIECSGTRKDDHPASFSAISLKFIAYSPDLENKEFEKLIHLAATKYCSVAGSLDPDIKVEHSYEIIID